MRRSLASELLQMATVFAVPIAVILVFPCSAIGFKASSAAASAPAVVAFVRLDAEAEHNALKVAKSSLRAGTSRALRFRADLSFGELPEEPVQQVLLSSPVRRALATPPLSFGIPVYGPSSAAPAPVQLPATEQKPPPLAFPREEMLRID